MTCKDITKNMSQKIWDQTPIFNNGVYSLREQCNKISGDLVFGRGISKSTVAFKLCMNFMEKSSQMEIMKGIPTGKVILSPPTQKDCFSKIQNICYYSSNSKYITTKVTDLWASKLKSIKPGHPINKSDLNQKRMWENGGKRFTGKTLSLSNNITDIIKNSRGLLSEGHVISFLNFGLQCPECGQIGKIGWCDGDHRSVNCFRDAICTNCKDNGVITLFEIKTRWDNQNKSNGTYAGSFAAINTLMTLNANIYLVIASRDTGTVRIGKITNAKMYSNKNWMYSLQEGLGWGSPSSYVICEDGMFTIPMPMTPLEDTLNEKYLNDIYTQVFSTLEYG